MQPPAVGQTLAVRSQEIFGGFEGGWVSVDLSQVPKCEAPGAPNFSEEDAL